MTVEKAKQLCIKAHEGQWRNGTPLKDRRYLTFEEEESIRSKGWFIRDGKRISYTTENGWLIQEPYHTHPIAVADMMTTDEEKVIALLHDVIEDTTWTFYEEPMDGKELEFRHYLKNESKNEKVEIDGLTAVCLLRLKKEENQSYKEYIIGISKSWPLCRKVKIADICHNLSDNPTEKQKQKYLSALPILLNAL